MINLTPIVKQLLKINVIAFIITYLLYAINVPIVENFILFNVQSEYFRPYQLITYMFLHSSALHILFNMLGLVTFGSDIEERLGSKKFLQYYLIMGIVSGLCHSIFITNPVLGASGAVWGVMMMYALFNPNTILQLYFFIPVKVKYIVSAFFAIELYLVLVGSNDGVSHIAHIGGALTGMIIYLLNRK
jgi:membrane associated rhomboid family serine protease